MWSVAAQGLASASNFGVQFGLVLTMSAQRFGSLVVGFAVFYLALALGRAWAGDPLVAMADSPADVAGLWPMLRRRLIVLGSAATLLVLLWSALAEGVRLELAILAVGMPALLLQDGHRYRAWALQRFPRVVGLDACWLATSIAVVGAVVVVNGRSAVNGRVVMLAWVAGGVVAWQLARLLTVQRPSTLGADEAAWDEAVQAAGDEADETDETDETDEAGDDEGRQRQAASRRLSVQQAILAVDANGLPVAVAAAANATVTAAVRAVVLPFAPMTSVLAGLRVLVLPVLRDAARRGHVRATIVKVSALYSGVAVAIAVATLAALAVVPNAWLGESGELVRAWFPLGAVVVASRMIGLPLADVLSLGPAPVRVARIRIATSGLDWSSTLIGAVAFGMEGAIFGRAGAGVASLAIWASMVVLSLRGSEADDPIGEGDGASGEGELSELGAASVMGGGPQQ